jgi:hypothetical protein
MQTHGSFENKPIKLLKLSVPEVLICSNDVSFVAALYILSGTRSSSQHAVYLLPGLALTVGCPPPPHLCGICPGVGYSMFLQNFRLCCVIFADGLNLRCHENLNVADRTHSTFHCDSCAVLWIHLLHNGRYASVTFL